MTTTPDPRGGARKGAGRKPIMKERVAMTCYVEKKHVAKLTNFARHTGVSVSAAMRRIIDELELSQEG